MERSLKRIGRFFARISIRLLTFNLLLVFLPLAGVLFLGAYEKRLESAEVRSMTEQARLLAGSIASDGALDAKAIAEVLARSGSREARFRVVDPNGTVVADSHRITPPPRPQRPGSKRRNTLYRIASSIAGPIVRWIRPPERPLEIDFYENATTLRGAEVRAALAGREAVDKKISAGGQRSVTLYRSVPIVANGRVVGAVVASQSTYTILQDLYAVRLGILQIFVTSVVVAVLVSIFFSTTIVTPLRQLRVDARSILDRRGRISGHFKGSKRLDEIGELSRALERIVRRLDSHMRVVEIFASDVSHEFKNPLASIRNANEMLAEVTEPEDRRRFVKMVEQEVARMERLLNGVREVTLINAGLGREELQRIDIRELVAKIVEGFRMREGWRVTFEVATGELPLMVDGSEDRLLQVFENVLDNATGFSPRGGTVRVETAAEDGLVVTRIADEGPGIPEQHLRKIFDRFFTYRTPAARQDGRHTGLGLSIVKAIVEGYGGSIRAANAAKGAVFEIRLPRSAS